MFYRNFFSIFVDDFGCCVVPLEELYIKGKLDGDYPIVGKDGEFVGNFKVELAVGNGASILSDIVHNKPLKYDESFPVTLLQQTPPHLKTHLLILDTISSLCLSPSPPPSSTSLQSTLYIRDAYSRTTLYRTPYYI